MRGLMRLGSSALVLLAIMFIGSLGLWVGVPLAWLWIGSQVQAATDSLLAALGTAFGGVVLTVIAAIPVLSALSNRYRRRRLDRGLDDTGHLALEGVLVLSAGLALVAFSTWFFLLSGTAPLGLHVR
jgi:hypothetical protein